MNEIKLTTTDGEKIIVQYNDKEYEYSINDNIIDTSDLVKQISEKETYEEIEVKRSELDDYLSLNPDIKSEFLELIKFIESIVYAYNKAVKDLVDEEVNI